MPVDYPAPVLAPTRRLHLRKLSLAFGFLVTLGLLMVLHTAFDFSRFLT